MALERQYVFHIHTTIHKQARDTKLHAALCDTWQQHGARTDPRYQDAATYIEKTCCNKTLVVLPLRAI